MAKTKKPYKKTVLINLTTSDSEDGSEVSNDNFYMTLSDEEAAEVGKAVNKNHDEQKKLLEIFKVKIKCAVTNWFNTDIQGLRDEIELHGFGYDFEHEADEGQSELDYARGKFTARMVAYIPTTILSDHNIVIATRVDDASFEYDYADSLFDE